MTGVSLTSDKMNAPSDRITRLSVTDEVAKRIRSEIQAGVYEIGQKLPTEMELRDRYGVSRSTIREAMRILQTNGFVELRPGTGAFVSAIHDRSESAIRSWFIEKETELDEMMDVRVAVEPLALRLAIEKAETPELEQIAGVQEQFREAVATGDPMELARLDEEFHTRIIAASHNSLLIKINHLLVDAFREYRTRAFGIPENVSNAIGPHDRIVAGLLERDIAGAQSGMEEHLRISLEDIEKVAHD